MKVILDTDPGIDDALAFILLKAMPEISLQAITTTHGNTTVQKCTENAKVRRYYLNPEKFVFWNH
jgi:pyrimidine-specific ribonucleoside hydrolase